LEQLSHTLIKLSIPPEQNKFGFVFWIVSNLYMVIRFAVIGEYAQMTLFFIYFLLAIRGIYAWSKKEETTRKVQ